MNSLNKTFLPINNYANRKWFIIDCKNQKLGRLSTIVSALLKGKIKPHYSPSIDSGDYVILINANSIAINKTSKHYIVNHPGRPGHSLKIKNVSECLPQFTIEKSVKGMLSKSEKKRLMKRLFICNEQNHPYQAQNPIKLDILNFYSSVPNFNIS